MCDFHYQKLCFHPEKVDDGQVAIKCEAHNCTHCTDKTWQKHRIKQDIDYFSSLLAIAKGSLSSVAQGINPDVLEMNSTYSQFRDPRVSSIPDDAPSRLFRGV
ncbi:MAG: hypothetical protein ACQESE_05235 [Nanobdellota archaeon]